jgi:hypothetical protein
MRARTVLALIVGALSAPATAAADVSGPAIVGFVNAQRAANGIPAGITEDPALSDGCAKHNDYSSRNNTLGHSEDPSLPGYTPEGDAAARTSVLYSGGGPWTAVTNPFETAPIHLHQLLAPRISRMGASENSGYGCATTQGVRDRPAPPSNVTYTYPGDGANDWFQSQTASEGPYTPGERVGIPAGTRTGPYLYVMFDGPDLSGFESAGEAKGSLAGPGGEVPVAVADNTTEGLEGYLPTGAEIIPRIPLAPSTTYTAKIAATVDGKPFAYAWRFTTAEGPPPFTAKVARRGKKILVKIKASADIEARAKVAGKGATKSLKAGATWKQRFAAPNKPAGVRIVVTVAGGRFVVRDKK